jgi:hypothetical protein
MREEKFCLRNPNWLVNYWYTDVNADEFIVKKCRNA